MNKSEASAVMHEILAALGESVAISAVSLDYIGLKLSKPPERFQLNIKCDLDENSLKRIKPILDKRNLKMDLIKGSLLIFSV